MAHEISIDQYNAFMRLPKHELVQMYLERCQAEKHARAKWRSYSNRYTRLRDKIRAAQAAQQAQGGE